jgi:ankyrin repeat protein
MEALIAKGAEVNAADNDGQTALMLASLGGHMAAMEALIAKGAEVTAAQITARRRLRRRAHGGDGWLCVCGEEGRSHVDGVATHAFGYHVNGGVEHRNPNVTKNIVYHSLQQRPYERIAGRGLSRRRLHA